MNTYKYLHRFGVLLAVMTLLLITKGGLVHSQGAGLSVPDWPTTYGENMFTFPPSKWVGGIFYEHVHRLIGSIVGFLMIIELVWIWKAEASGTRRWMKNLALSAFAAVCIQGVLGGLTVLYGLPTAVSVSHGMLAEIFLIMTVAMAMGTSPRWISAEKISVNAPESLFRLLGITFAFTFVQILMGAITRHTYSGMVIPDFPLAFGKIIPDFVNFNVTIHYLHRVGAVILSILIFTQCGRIWRAGEELAYLRLPVTLAACLVVVQIWLGGMVIWTFEAPVINTLHTAVGASIFMANFIAFFRAGRFFHFSSEKRQVSDPVLSGGIHAK